MNWSYYKCNVRPDTKSHEYKKYRIKSSKQNLRIKNEPESSTMIQNPNLHYKVMISPWKGSRKRKNLATSQNKCHTKIYNV